MKLLLCILVYDQIFHSIQPFVDLFDIGHGRANPLLEKPLAKLSFAPVQIVVERALRAALLEAFHLQELKGLNSLRIQHQSFISVSNRVVKMILSHWYGLLFYHILLKVKVQLGKGLPRQIEVALVVPHLFQNPWPIFKVGPEVLGDKRYPFERSYAVFDSRVRKERGWYRLSLQEPKYTLMDLILVVNDFDWSHLGYGCPELREHRVILKLADVELQSRDV